MIKGNFGNGMMSANGGGQRMPPALSARTFYADLRNGIPASATFTRATQAWNPETGAVVGVNVSRQLSTGTLFEEASTNLLLWGSDFTNAAWTKRGTSSAAMTATNRQGTPNSCSDVTVGTTAGPNDIFYTTALSGLGANTVVSPSFWFKKASSSGILFLANANNASQWNINLALIGTGWERITATHPSVTVLTPYTASAGGQVAWQMYAASGTISFAIERAQIEVLPYSTSEIPTTSVTVTRGAETLTNPTAGALTAAQGTIAMTVNVDTALQANATVMTFFDHISGAGNRLLIQKSAANTYLFQVTDNAGTGTAKTVPITLTPGKHRLALTWGGGVFNGWIDSVQYAGATSNVPSVLATNFYIGLSNAGTLQSDQPEKKLAIYNRPLTAAEVMQDYRSNQ